MTAIDESMRLLPDPEPREVQYTIISVDDHLVEPPNMFEGRLPAKFQDRAPKVIKLEDGTEPWIYEDELVPQSASNAVVGQTRRDRGKEPVGYKDMRAGCYDVDARVHDMDLNGIWASANFPSAISGFCGRGYSESKDQELGLAVMRAWNDWMFEDWHGAYPERFIPMGITWLNDPEVGAAEIRRNAERGFTSVTLPELPHRHGLPSVHSDYWDPILRACEETDTVITLHVGSSGMNPLADDAPAGVLNSLFEVSSLEAAVDWIWSAAGVRFPKLKIVMAEGGIGWVPMLIDRLEYSMGHVGGPSHGYWTWDDVAPGADVSPADVLRRNFYFAVLDDPKNLELRHHIGIDHIMIEVDYPHADSTWPDSQAHFARLLGGMPDDEIRRIAHGNAARLFRHPLPEVLKP